MGIFIVYNINSHRPGECYKMEYIGTYRGIHGVNFIHSVAFMFYPTTPSAVFTQLSMTHADNEFSP